MTIQTILKITIVPVILEEPNYGLSEHAFKLTVFYSDGFKMDSLHTSEKGAEVKKKMLLNGEF